MGKKKIEVDNDGNPWIRDPEWSDLGMVISGGESYPGCITIHMDFGGGGLEWVSDDKVLADPKKFERAKLAILQGIDAWSDGVPSGSLARAALEGLKDALRTWKIKKRGA